MRLFHDCAEAVNANTITPDETKFCYMEVKLNSDQEQFGSKIKIIEHTMMTISYQTFKDGRVRRPRMV